MKDLTSNSSLLDSTLSNNLGQEQLSIVTGKGGVGKTLFSLSLSLLLKSKFEQSNDILYSNFDQGEQDLMGLDIPTWSLNTFDSAKEYIGRKLGSEMIASWVMKTPFFNSMFEMTPGLGQMILLGHVIDRLQQQDNLKLVLDSPSSGHARTMLESPQNFGEIFGIGTLGRDIDKIKGFTQDPEKVEIFIVAVPSEMSLQESMELKSAFNDLSFTNVKVVLNSCYSLNQEINNDPDGVPEFIQKKLFSEHKLIEEYGKDISLYIPYFVSGSALEVCRSCFEYLRGQYGS